MLQWWGHPGPAGGPPGQPRVRGQHARQGQGRGQDHCAGGDNITNKILFMFQSWMSMGPLCSSALPCMSDEFDLTVVTSGAAGQSIKGFNLR